MKSAQNIDLGTSGELRFVNDRMKGSASIVTTGAPCKWLRCVIACVAGLATLFFATTTPRQASAIDFSIEYSTDTGGDESPSWDSNGAILKAHFYAAVDIWERLLPSPGSYTFDFQWDDDT